MDKGAVTGCEAGGGEPTGPWRGGGDLGEGLGWGWAMVFTLGTSARGSDSIQLASVSLGLNLCKPYAIQLNCHNIGNAQVIDVSFAFRLLS